MEILIMEEDMGKLARISLKARNTINMMLMRKIRNSLKLLAIIQRYLIGKSHTLWPIILK